MPQSNEESRQLAEALADLHYVLAIIIKNADRLIPGEAIDELKKAWETSEQSMKDLVNKVLYPRPRQPGGPPQPPLEKELSGHVGKLKMSMLGRLKDRFLMFWNSQPETDEKRSKAADAACDI